MGLLDNKCDSCGEEVGYLFPIAIIDELPSGGTRMIVKYYCWGCYDIMTGEAKEDLEDEDEDDERESNEREPD